MKKKAILALSVCVALSASSLYAQCFGGRCVTNARRASYATYQGFAQTRYYYAPTAPYYSSCETSIPAPCETVVETPQACAPCEPVVAPCAPVETCAPSVETIERISKEVDECLTGACPLRTASRVAVRTAVAPVKAVVNLLDVANRTRAHYGLPALKYDAALEAGAEFQAQYCSEVGSLQHGYGVAEILAQNNQGLETAINQWLASPGHRALLLNGGYTRAGIGVVRDKSGRCWCAMRFR